MQPPWRVVDAEKKQGLPPTDITSEGLGSPVITRGTNCGPAQAVTTRPNPRQPRPARPNPAHLHPSPASWEDFL